MAQRSFIRLAVVRAGLAVLIGWGVYTVLGQSGDGTLKVEIRDKATGEVVPAMVCITSLDDGTWRTPPDGRVAGKRYTTVKDFMEPPEWKPGQIGPVRLTSPDPKSNQRITDFPFWKEPVAYFVSRPFSITLPAGKWRLAVARGLEYLPVFEEFEIAPGASRVRKVELKRWVEMSRQGWWSGDNHVHHPRLKPEHDQFLMTWLRAEDVHLVNILGFGDIRGTYMPQSHYGKASHYRVGDYVLVSGQEDPRNDIQEQGHTMALNIQATVRDTGKYHLYDYMFDGVHAQGGLVGYAHCAWAGAHYHALKPGQWPYPTWDPTINVVRGKVDFLEILQFRSLGVEDYYDFLNLGVKLIASAGSDVPWGDSIGESRVYVYTGRRFSPEDWFAGLKQSHTFVTNGPMVTLTANDAIPGDELKIRGGSPVRVRARAWAPAAIGSPGKLELISQGRVIRSVEATGAETELKLEYSLLPAQGQWLAARVTSRNGALAHTSPIYVVVDGQPFLARAEAPGIAAKRMKVLDYIGGRLSDPRFVRGWAEGEREALEARIGDARARYQQLQGAR